MSQNKNIFLSIFISLFWCNQVDAMKRAREGQMQNIVVVASVVAPVDFHVDQVLELPAKQYWDGKSPYDGSMVIKATGDHDCKHCNLKITDESLAAHAFKHPDIYGLRPQKKIRIEEVIEITGESSSSSEESSNSSSDSSSSSEDPSSFSSESSSDSSEDEEDNKTRFMRQDWKNGYTVKHYVCQVKGCKFATMRFKEMNNHKRLHGVDCSVCKKCHFRSDRRRVFENHVQTHLPKAKRSNIAQCKICGKVLSKESSLGRHMISQHS